MYMKLMEKPMLILYKLATSTCTAIGKKESIIRISATTRRMKIFPREKHMNHMKDFFTAARGGRPAVCNFDYSDPLARIVLSGNLASLAGKGKKIAL